MIERFGGYKYRLWRGIEIMEGVKSFVFSWYIEADEKEDRKWFMSNDSSFINLLSIIWKRWLTVTDDLLQGSFTILADGVVWISMVPIHSCVWMFDPGGGMALLE